MSPRRNGCMNSHSTHEALTVIGHPSEVNSTVPSPLRVDDPEAGVESTCENEERVRQSVEKRNDAGFDSIKNQNPAFGTSADRSRNVGDCRASASSGKDERAQLGETGVHLVNPLLQFQRLPGRRVRLEFLLRVRKGRSDGEERCLRRTHTGCSIIRQIFGRQEAEQGVELIHRSVGLDQRVILADPPA